MLFFLYNEEMAGMSQKKIFFMVCDIIPFSPLLK